MRWTTFPVLVCLVLLSGNRACGQRFTVELELGGQRVEGSPLAWSANKVMLLSRDGHLWDFKPQEATSFRRTADGFESYSQGEIRGQLAAEFGRRFEVSGTGHYLVVHPAGERNQWADRFEELYRSFIHYFAVRGFKPVNPPFPLVAVVFPEQSEFLAYAARTGVQLAPGVLGYYSPTTNRILLYDVTAGRDDELWHINAETIIHEAAHQTAFNTGIHSRYTTPPRWVIEGLGTMFEARGVWNSRRHPLPGDRLNRYRLDAFRKYVAERRARGSLAEFVSSDRSFGSDPDAAYAEAWALTMFLVETRPREYIEYLKSTASRAMFSNYRSPERLRDFTDVFGEDLAMFEARFLRYFRDLRE